MVLTPAVSTPMGTMPMETTPSGAMPKAIVLGREPQWAGLDSAGVVKAGLFWRQDWTRQTASRQMAD